MLNRRRIEFFLICLLQGQPDAEVPAYECNRTYATEAMCNIAETDVAARYIPRDNLDLTTACCGALPQRMTGRSPCSMSDLFGCRQRELDGLYGSWWR